MSHVTTRKGASTDEKDKRQSDNSPVRDMKKKVAANAEKEKMAAEKQTGDKKDKQSEKSDKNAESKHNGDKSPEKSTRGAEKPNGEKPKEKSVEKPEDNKEKAVEKPADKKEKAVEKPADKKEKSAEKPADKKEKTVEKPADKKEKAVEKPADKKEKAVEKPADKKEKAVEKPADKKEKAVEKPADKKEKAVDKPADKKETEKAKDDAAKGEKSTKPARHNGVSDVTLGVNGNSDVTGPASTDSDEDMVIVIDDQENDELFPELTYDDSSDVDGEGSEGFRSATRRSQAKSARTPETPRPASDKRGDTATATAAATATNTEGMETVHDAPKEAMKVLKLKEDPSSASERKLRSADSPRKTEGTRDEDAGLEEVETSQDGEARKPDTNFSKSRVKVSPYRRSMRLADQTASSVNATYTGNNTTMEMDITESSFSEPGCSADASGSAPAHVTSRAIRGRRSYKQMRELSMRTVTRRPPVAVLDNPPRPTGTVVGRKRKPDYDAPSPAVEATESTDLTESTESTESDSVHAKRMRLLDKLMSPFRRALPSSTPLPQRRATPIVGINTDLPLSAPVLHEPFEAEALKNVPTAAQPTAQSAQLPQGVLNGNGVGHEAAKKCIVM